MRYLIIALLALFFVSCGTSPAAPTSFLQDPYKMEEGKNLQLVWKSDNAAKGNYTKLALKPVGLTYMRRLGWWDKKNATSYHDDNIFPGFDSGDNRKAGTETAKIFESEFLQAFLRDPQKKVRRVPHTYADRQTLLLEIQIIELVPIKTYLPAMGSVKGGTMAIEGKITNAETGELLMMFSDRRIENSPKQEMPGKMNRYSHVKPLSRQWCDYFVRLASTGLQGQ